MPPTKRTGDFARRDLDALNELLDSAVALARRWTRASARGEHRIFPVVRGAWLKKRLTEPLPRRGATPQRILGQLTRDIVPFLRDNGHPRFFGYVMSPPSAAGIAADLLASAFDQNLTAWRSGPAATEIERLVVDWMRRIVGMPAGTDGLLTSGGSMATFTALAVARARKQSAQAAEHGLGRLGNKMMTVYASEEAHMSVPRAVQLLGLGSRALRTVPTDENLRIDTPALERAIRADRARGHIPFCVVASAGTVNTGAVDPLGDVAAIARRHRLWLHVDAAYGGPLGLSARHRRLLTGLRQADSVALDPHKWLYAPLDVGCVLFRDAAAPHSAFATHGEYAAVLEPGQRESYVFFENGPELSRRFRALKVWMILKYHGADALGRRIDEEIALAQDLAARIERHPELALLAPVPTSIVCFRYVPAARGRWTETRLEELNRRLLLAVQKAGRIYLTNARVKGRFALRACLVNFRTTPRDVATVVSEIVRTGRMLARPRSR